MSSGYWTREWELFARAWETYIYDKLEKAGRANNYLVSGDYFDRPERVYPQGDERSDLFELYERFVETIKREYNLAGFVKFTDQRTDEYLDLNENNPKEEVTAGIIVKKPEYTEKEKKYLRLNAKMKMQKLLIILSEDKFEKGGGWGTVVKNYEKTFTMKHGGEINNNTVTDVLIHSCSCNKNKN